jgi:hypothetical protein
MDIFGDGDYQTHFTVWAPVVDGSMLELSTTKTFASMSWKIHGMHWDGCSTECDAPSGQRTPAWHQCRTIWAFFPLDELTGTLNIIGGRYALAINSPTAPVPRAEHNVRIQAIHCCNHV